MSCKMTKLKPCPFCGRSQNLSIEDAGGVDRYVNGEPDGSIPTLLLPQHRNHDDYAGDRRHGRQARALVSGK